MMEKKSFLYFLIQKIGGWYLPLSISVTQVVSSIGAIAADYTVVVNADFSTQELSALLRFIVISALVTYLFLFSLIFFRYRGLRKEISYRSVEAKSSEAGEEKSNYWAEITSISWRYSLWLIIASTFGMTLPAVIFASNILKLEPNQLIYIFLGSFSSSIGIASISLLILDYLLKPIREMLLPNKFEDQLEGDHGLKFSIKIQLIVFALILLSVLLTAPIGYHQTDKALKTGLEEVLIDMRVQSLVVAMMTILFGIGLSFFFTRSLSSPINDLLKTFSSIESGDLKQRATVSTSDEIGQLAIYFNRMIAQLDNLQDSLESQIAERTEQLRATAEVGRAASSILDPDDLVEEIVNLITERLGYYYAAIFILSPDGSWAELRSATGEAGAELKARQHRLAVGGKSMVGSAISLRQARIAHDVGLEAVRFNNPLLPETRSEIALPLMVGGRVVGALDAQSTEPNVFDVEKTEILLGMANQVAVALENARLYKEAQEALREIRESQQAQLSTAWSQMTEGEEKLEFSVGQESYQTEVDGAKMNIPLSLRDQIIGEVSIVGDENWTEDDRAWVTAVARQAAFAIENARLLEESQQTALQERVVSEITGKIWTSTTIEGILQVAITELGRTLGANEAVIKLDVED